MAKAKLHKLRLQYKRVHIGEPIAFATCQCQVTATEIIAKSGEITSRLGAEPEKLTLPITFGRNGKQPHGYGWQVTLPSLHGLKDV